VPCGTQKEYKAYINSLVTESTFKLISSVTAFMNLGAEERRAILTEIAAIPSDTDIAEKNDAYRKLLEAVGNKGMNGYQAEQKARAKKLKDQLESIPTRIDEATRNMPKEESWEEIQEKLNKTNTDIQAIDQLRQDEAEKAKTLGDDRALVQLAINKARAEIMRLQDTANAEADRKNRENNHTREQLKASIANLESTLTDSRSRLKDWLERQRISTSRRNDLLARYREISTRKAPEADPNALECHYCHQELQVAMQEEYITKLHETFKAGVKADLDANIAEGKKEKENLDRANAQIESLNTSIANAEKELQKAKGELEALPESKRVFASDIIDNDEVKRLSDSIEKLQRQLEGMTAPQPDAELIERRNNLVMIRDTYVSALAKKGDVERTKARIAELEAEEKALSKELAGVQKVEFLIEDFQKTKMSLVEKAVNEMFKAVIWKLFRKNLNGGEEQICECLVDGIPYESANNAGRINAGLDIANVLSNYYGTRAPIFIDNAESVNEFIPTVSQRIELIVTNKPLQIELL
jgi:chromosome segregation ATPase